MDDTASPQLSQKAVPGRFPVWSICHSFCRDVTIIGNFDVAVQKALHHLIVPLRSVVGYWIP